MTVTDFKILLNTWMSNSWLAHHNFSCDEIMMEKAIRSFEKDYGRWYPDDNGICIEKLNCTPQLISVLLYRVAREIHLNDTECGVDSEAKKSFCLLARHIGQIEFFYSAEIGEGLKINHGIGSVIGARCKIGKNCMIHQNCTVGDRNGGRPVIGNNVVLYAGAMVLGDISIGDNCIIGANSVVTKSFPANSILVGSPARNINQNE